MENENEEELIEWWAHMLVDAGAEYKSKHIFFSNVLKQIGAIELELLEVVVRNGKGDYKLVFVREAEFVGDFNFPGHNLALSDSFEVNKIRKSVNVIKKSFERPGVIILDLFVDDENSRQYQDIHRDYRDDELSSWQILQSLQIVRLDYRRIVAGSVEYRGRIATITELGADFYFSCHDKDFDQKYSSEVPFKRRRKKRASPDHKRRASQDQRVT